MIRKYGLSMLRKIKQCVISKVFIGALALFSWGVCHASEEMYANNVSISGDANNVVVIGDYPEPYGTAHVTLAKTDNGLVKLSISSQLGRIVVPDEFLAEVVSPRLLDTRLTWSVGRDGKKHYVTVVVPFGDPQGDPVRYSRKHFIVVDNTLAYTLLDLPSGDWYESTLVVVSGDEVP